MEITNAYVVDWAEAGPLYEQRDDEDHSVRVLRPETAAVVRCETAIGEIFNHPHEFGTDFESAERFAARVRQAGVIDPARWVFDRVIYGSSAYVSGGYEEAELAREKTLER